MVHKCTCILSFESLFWNIFQFVFVGSVFWFTFMCLHGCASIPSFESLFWRMPVLCLLVQFFDFFFLGSRCDFCFQWLYD